MAGIAVEPFAGHPKSLFNDSTWNIPLLANPCEAVFGGKPFREPSDSDTAYSLPI
jgi:hypothetical protein